METKGKRNNGNTKQPEDNLDDVSKPSFINNNSKCTWIKLLRHRVAGWIKKTRPNCMLPIRDSVQL